MQSWIGSLEEKVLVHLRPICSTRRVFLLTKTPTPVFVMRQIGDLSPRIGTRIDHLFQDEIIHHFPSFFPPASRISFIFTSPVPLANGSGCPFPAVQPIM